MEVPLAKYCTVNVPSVSLALAVSWTWRLNATELGEAMMRGIVGARLVAAAMLILEVEEAVELPEESRAMATISFPPKGMPTSEVPSRHVLPV